MNPVMIPTDIRSPQQKFFMPDRLWELDKAVNEFIENITEKGFKVIAISVNTNKQERVSLYHYNYLWNLHIER